MPDEDIFIDEATVAARLSIPLKSLRDRRARGLSIPYVRVGKRQIRYHWPTVRDYFLRQMEVNCTPKPTIDLTTISVPIKHKRSGRPRLPI